MGLAMGLPQRRRYFPRSYLTIGLKGPNELTITVIKKRRRP